MKLWLHKVGAALLFNFIPKHATTDDCCSTARSSGARGSAHHFAPVVDRKNLIREVGWDAAFVLSGEHITQCGTLRCS